MDCLFCKFVKGSIKTNKVYEDDLVLAFYDISPQAPTHILLIPKKHISTVNDTSKEDQLLLGHLLLKAKEIAKQQKIDEEGFRLVMNCNEQGGQSVFHIHLHLLGGRNLSWPPG